MGMIIYEAKWLYVCGDSPPRRGSVPTEDVGLLSKDEKIALAKGFMSYTGTYGVLEDGILHHTKLGFIPNWVDTTFIRFAFFEDDILWLTTPPISSRDMDYIGCLAWERIHSHAKPAT